MGRIIKNGKTKLLDKNPLKQRLATIGKSKDEAKKKKKTTKDKGKLLLNETNTPKKISYKKEKFRRKHEKLMDKFRLITKQQEEERARKNREKTKIVGDLKPLKDALPSLDDIFRLSKEREQLKTGVRKFDQVDENKKLNPKQKIKKKKEEFIKRVKSFQTILKDPEFKKNPREAIRYHIQYTHGLIEE